MSSIALGTFSECRMRHNQRPILFLLPSPHFTCCDVFSTFLFKAIYVVLLAVACLVNAANLMATLASLKARHLFTPEGKWSPLSFMKLTHEVRGGMGERVLSAPPKMPSLFAVNCTRIKVYFVKR